MSNLIGHEEWSNKPSRTQVYLDTHDGADKRLPHRERSFISFTYGGKPIEDFYLIATLKGDRMERQLYGDFSDNTSTYDVIDGQFYWGSHYTTNKLELQLSTDEITEQQLQDFKAWFTPGEGKELILAEYPNRGIWARISQVPGYHMLPFEKKIQKKLAGNTYTISTTVYRGDIDIEFVMDDPFWYSIYNVLPSYGQDGAEDWFKTFGIVQENNTADENSLMANKDYLKIILEDSVPTKEMIDSNNIITGEKLYSVQNNPLAMGKINNEEQGNAYAGDGVNGARLQNALPQLTDNSPLYLYYAGTAPTPTILTFSLIPSFAENDDYISAPKNKICNEAYPQTNALNYNTINIGTKQFKFTTPSIYTGYNQALKIVSSCEVGESIIDIRTKLIEGVNEYYSRTFALGTLNFLQNNNTGVNDDSTITVDFQEAFNVQMKKFLIGNAASPERAIFQFNSKTGEAIGTFNIYQYDSDDLSKLELTLVQENVGDMIYNQYLYLNERNHFNAEGRITTNECISITTDYPETLYDFTIEYKYMYL